MISLVSEIKSVNFLSAYIYFWENDQFLIELKMVKSSKNGLAKIWSSLIKASTHLFHLKLNEFNNCYLTCSVQTEWLIECIPINFKCFNVQLYEHADTK